MASALSTSQVRSPSKTGTPFRVVQGAGSTYLQYDITVRRSTSSSGPNGRLTFTDKDFPVAINILPHEQVYPAIAALLKQYYDLEASVAGLVKERDEALEEAQRAKSAGLSASRANQASRKKD